MLDDPLLMDFARVTVFVLMLQNGVTIPVRDLMLLQRKRALLLRSIVAVVILVPVAVLVILMLFDLPPEVATGLSLLAAAPGAPLTTQRTRIAAGSAPLAADLQFLLVLLAIPITPLTLTLFDGLFPLLPELASSPVVVAREISIVSILPVAVGLFIQRFLPRTGELIGKPLEVISKALFLLLAILITWPAVRASIQLGGMAALSIVIMAAAALAIGHLMAAGATSKQKASIATACIARNLGLAVVVAAANSILAKLLPTIVAYMLLSMIVALPYAIWIRRRERRSRY